MGRYNHEIYILREKRNLKHSKEYSQLLPLYNSSKIMHGPHSTINLLGQL